MTTTYIQPPPPPQGGMGCLGKGCLILIAFAIFLVIAFATGGFFALRHIRATYLPSEGRSFSVPAPVDANSAEVKQRWESFEQEAEAGNAASITLTEAELNSLLNSYPDTRGKYQATLLNDSARVQLTMPILNVRIFRGRYLNADCVVQASADGDPRHAKIREIKVNGQSVPDEILDWQYGSHSIHGAIAGFLDEYHITRLGIADGKITAACEASDHSD